MEHYQREHIRKNLVKLANCISNLPMLLTDLYSREIISKSTKQIIEHHPDDVTKTYELFTSLMKTEKYFDIIESLNETENPKAAQILQSGIPHSSSSPIDSNTRPEITNTMKQLAVTITS